MAFASTKDYEGVFGDLRVTSGTWTTDTTGGDINAGLHKCLFISLTPASSPSPTEQCAVNETLPCDGSAITIVVTSGVDGNWIAYGY
jgi:hypothetical protein